MRDAMARRSRTMPDAGGRPAAPWARPSLAPSALLGALLVLPPSAAGAQTADRPSDRPPDRPCHLVADGRRVRARERDTQGANGTRTTLVGTALAWGTPAPRLITASGDTLPLRAAHQVWVSGGRTARRTVRGAVIGWGAGVVATLADCGLASTCGEQNPVPLLGLFIGAAIGRRFRTERWTRVPAVTSSTCAATPP